MNIVIKNLLFLTVLVCIVPVKADMIVVQGSVQLWPVTIINKSNLTLVVRDEIEDPEGNSVMMKIIGNVTPNNQFTFQWPSATQKPNARKIEIFGFVNAALPTNHIIMGNTADATHPMIPSGDHTIISTGKRHISLADYLNPNQPSAR